VRWLQGWGVLIDAIEIDAADESNAPVNHHDFAMIAIVRVLQLQKCGRCQRMKHENARAGLTQPRKKIRICVCRAVSIHDDIHGNPRTELALEEIAEAFACHVNIFECVIF
jgi:hypothetical protein